MAPLSEVLHAPLSLPESIWQMLNHDAVEGHPAVSALHQPAYHLSNLTGQTPGQVEYASWTFAQLKRAVFIVSKALLDQGVERGICLYTFLPNGIECVLLAWVSALLQLTLVPLDVNVLRPERSEQLEHYLSERGSTDAMVVVPDRSAAGHLDNVLRATKHTARARCTIDVNPPSGWISLAQLTSDEPTERLQDEPGFKQDKALDDDLRRIALMLHTSGTSTGKPRGCPLSVRNILAGCASDYAFAEVTKCILTSAPNFGAIFTLMDFYCGGQ